jgi:hypothetical protein
MLRADEMEEPIDATVTANAEPYDARFPRTR